MSERPPLVTIVTPVLDRASSIERCLASVSAQTYTAVEHLVVDGGSTDGTVERVAAYRSRHELRWVSQPDRGMYEAINRGLGLARGAVLAYLNSDDLYLPWSIEVAVDRLRRGCDLVYGDLGVLVVGPPPAFRPQFYRDFDLAHFTHVEAIAQPTVFWSRAVTERIGGFDERYRLIADVEYWLRAAVSGASLCHVDEILALQSDHPGTLRSTRPDELRVELAEMRQRYRAHAAPPMAGALSVRLRARRDRVRLWAAARRDGAGRWPRFTAFLRANDIRPSIAGLLWYLAPGGLRPPRASMVDAEAFHRAVDRMLEQGGAEPGPAR
jgi:glycosyltransferase involved in cell wall biosynthesis